MSKNEVMVKCDCNTHALEFEHMSEETACSDGKNWHSLYISDWNYAGYEHTGWKAFIERLEAAYYLLTRGCCKRDGLLVIESPERAKQIVDICSEFILECSVDQWGRYPDEV